ncbi:DUF4124 domain-containing protein [Solilutibacter pythonis]|nr:DUF4124 domain-containing protein [Lysobacter pythonis]
MRPVFLLVATCTLTLLCVTTGLAQEKVYQWRDSQGRTHYSGTPPKSGDYSVRGAGAPAPAPMAKEEPAAPETEQCRQARANLAILKSGTPVQMKSDGEGKSSRVLDDEERAAQTRLAQTIIDTNCTPKK